MHQETLGLVALKINCSQSEKLVNIEETVPGAKETISNIVIELDLSLTDRTRTRKL